MNTQNAAEPSTGGKPWAFVWNATFVLGAIMAVIGGVILSHFFGVLPAVIWTVPCVGLLMAVIYYAMRYNEGDAKAAMPFAVLHALTITLWMGSAVALWMTGNRAATVIAVMIPASWSIHIMFSGQRDLRILLGLIGLCVVPLLGFMLDATWNEYPLWIAIPASVSAVSMVVSIANSAHYSNQQVLSIQAAKVQAEATRQRLEFAIDAVGDGYFEINLDKLSYESNGRLAKSLGYADSVNTVEGLKERVHADDLAAILRHVKDARAGRITGWSLDVRVREANTNALRWMQIRARVLATPGEARRLICMMVDLTERKKLEQELRDAKESAEASNKAKTEFLANMSHEIRTPLNGVLGMAQALEAEEMTPGQREKVAVILDSGKSLTALLNDVLDLTKIEAGKLEISPVPGDFLHTMKRTRQLFQPVAEEKGLELSVRYSSDFPQRLTYDPVRVRQCVSNLISNAVKFTARGSVEVAISARGSKEAGYVVAVEVCDTGIGISADTQERLFQVFTQADGSTSRKFGGTGLGLAISRHLARLMGGDLTVSSEEGRGSRFLLTFKAAYAEAASQPTASTPGAKLDPAKRTLRGTRVLLTDDNAINRQVIKLFLAPHGCDIVEATNGKEALDAIASQPFDIVLLDVHMPVMDGKEAIQRLRAAKAPWATLPVIALTADAMSGDREKYLALGMSDYVSKPVDQRELVLKMHQQLKLETPAAAPPVAKSA